MSGNFENLEAMDEAQLRQLIQRAQEMLRDRGTKRLEELRQLAREAGFEVTLTKIGSQRGDPADGVLETEAKRKGLIGAGKRCSQNTATRKNPRETWAGRGRKPRWVETALAHDRKLEDLAIPAEA